jgi:hypothetical protein
VAQDLSDEFARARLLRLIKDLTRITGLDHMAAVHENKWARQVRQTGAISSSHDKNRQQHARRTRPRRLRNAGRR